MGPLPASRAELVTELADQIRANARLDTATAPAWARPLIGRHPLAAEIAVFRARTEWPRGHPPDRRQQYAAHRAPSSDSCKTPPWKRSDADTTRIARFRRLIDSIDPRLRATATGHSWPPTWPKPPQPPRPGPPGGRCRRRASATDELPAAALWWRISGELTHTATLATTTRRLRPAWITDLHDVFGSVPAETIISDPAWPGLVARSAPPTPPGGHRATCSRRRRTPRRHRRGPKTHLRPTNTPD